MENLDQGMVLVQVERPSFAVSLSSADLHAFKRCQFV